VSGRPSVRLVTGEARPTQTDGIRGRTLFPSPDFSHWPPFGRLAETWAVGSETPDPHPHVREEVVIHALSGALGVFDEAHRRTAVPPGAVTVLTAVREQVHDVNPQPGARAHWLALVLQLPLETPEPKLPFQLAAAVPEDGAKSGLSELRVVGARGPVQSALGLEMRRLTFEKPTDVALPVDPQDSVLIYVLAGRARVADTRLSAGSGFLGEGMLDLSISGEPDTQLIWAAVPNPT
jgi:redox-sensitive bicupin YhaK (pirin superfamily)